MSSEVTVRSEVAAGRLVAIPLDPPLTRELGVVRRRDKPADPVLDSFLAAIDERPTATRRPRRGRG